MLVDEVILPSARARFEGLLSPEALVSHKFGNQNVLETRLIYYYVRAN